MEAHLEDLWAQAVLEKLLRVGPWSRNCGSGRALLAEKARVIWVAEVQLDACLWAWVVEEGVAEVSNYSNFGSQHQMVREVEHAQISNPSIHCYSPAALMKLMQLFYEEIRRAERFASKDRSPSMGHDCLSLARNCLYKAQHF